MFRGYKHGLLTCWWDLGADELTTVKRLAHSRTALAQRVQRAQII